MFVQFRVVATHTSMSVGVVWSVCCVVDSILLLLVLHMPTSASQQLCLPLVS